MPGPTKLTSTQVLTRGLSRDEARRVLDAQAEQAASDAARGHANTTGKLSVGQISGTLANTWFSKTWAAMLLLQLGSSGSTQTASLASTFNAASVSILGTSTFRLSFAMPPPGMAAGNLVPFALSTENPQGTGLFLYQSSFGVNVDGTPYVDVTVSTSTGALPTTPIVASFRVVTLFFESNGGVAL